MTINHGIANSVEAVATVVVVRAALVAATAKVSATSAKAVSMTDLRVVVPVMSLPHRAGTLLRLGETSVPLHASRPLENRWASKPGNGGKVFVPRDAKEFLQTSQVKFPTKKGTCRFFFH